MSERFALSALDYIRRQLMSLDVLTPLRLFIRGAWPPGNVMQQACPYCELYIINFQDNPADYQTGRTGLIYNGGLRIIDNLADNTGYTNWLNTTEGRAFDVAGYGVMVDWMLAARNELYRCEHKTLGDLDVDNEVACEFSIRAGTLSLGLEQGQMANTWYNVGSLDFYIRAQRDVEN